LTRKLAEQTLAELAAKDLEAIRTFGLGSATGEK
jgi:hypothetical protein